MKSHHAKVKANPIKTQEPSPQSKEASNIMRTTTLNGIAKGVWD
jgi:hypothetical protein